jgi:hypothetical protein
MRCYLESIGLFICGRFLSPRTLEILSVGYTRLWNSHLLLELIPLLVCAYWTALSMKIFSLAEFILRAGCILDTIMTADEIMEILLDQVEDTIVFFGTKLLPSAYWNKEHYGAFVHTPTLKAY